MTHITPKAVLNTLEQGRTVEFDIMGKAYFIQQENNKGWDYISLWRMDPAPACLGRALFDIFDGISIETVLELMQQKCICGHSLLELTAETDLH